jgi:hypothetical protein
MKLKDGMVLQKMGKTFVAYDNNTSTLHELNEVGYFILDLVEKGKSEREMLTEIMRNYEITRDQAKEDLTTFLDILRIKDIIVGGK